MSLHASLSTLSRPSLLARPIILSGAHTTTLTASRRCLHASITASARVGATRGFSFTSNKLATTALKTGVKEREEGSAGVVVGGSGKGAEGPHFQGEHWSLLSSSSRGHLLGLWVMGIMTCYTLRCMR